MPKQYMRFISWNVYLDDFESADDAFSSKRVTRVRKSLENLKDSQYRFEQLELTDDLLDQFVVLYDAFMTKKEGGVVYPVKEGINANQEKGRKYHMLALWNGEVLEGGLIFSERKSAISVAYRVFPTSLDIATTASPAQIAEYMVVDAALKMGKARVNHGRDRNAYGINADIGLASFKMRSGAIPHISKNGNEIVDLPETLDSDILVCVGDEPGEICDELVLFTDLDEEEALKKYQISKYKGVPLRVKKR
ncbi:hypothetical protein HOI83_01230 [Candidatus Uhrbacteria bacterium]|jgi:hypothetical protein|nr:hypothetical protein [Candidatus Uhrbacteria bacterium]